MKMTKSVVIFAVVVPLSLIFWLLTYSFRFYKSDSRPVSPVRLLVSVLLPLITARWGLQHKSLDISGAIAGVLVAFVLTIANLGFCSALLVFFVFGSKVTKFRNSEKKTFEELKDGVQRNWIQVLCNAGIATEFAFLYLIEIGCEDLPINFQTHYNASWFCMAVLGSLCCSCGDTFASEIGSVLGNAKEAYLITNLKKVPRGTNGAVTIFGTLASFLGGAIVGLSYYVTILILTNTDYLMSSPPQWPLIPVGGLFGLLGSLIDSVLGATTQFSGYNKNTGCIVGRPDVDVKYINGTDLLDNHSVNLVSSFITALLAPRLAVYLWNTV